MRDEEFQRSPEQMMLEAASRCDPDVVELGLLLSEVSAAAAVPRLVLWFASPTSFYRFLTEAVPGLYCGDDDVGELLETLTSLESVIREEGLSLAVLDEVNEYLARWLRFDWLGTFEDLCAADTESTREVVDWFRADRREDAGEPVTAEETEEFAEYLTSLGNG